MRVLTFSSLFPNAVDPAHGIFVFRRASNLAKIPGVEAEVIAPVPWAPGRISPTRWRRFAGVPQNENAGELKVHHPRYFMVPRVSMPIHGLLMFLRTIGLARSLHQRRRFDCIDAHYVYPDGFAAVLLGKWLRIPVVVWALGTDINLFPSFPIIRPLIRWTLRNSSAVVAVASPLKRTMIGLGVPESKIRVIGNGVDTEMFHLMSKEQARRTLGLATEDKILVSVATLREAKGHQHVIAAMAKLTCRHPRVKLCLVGEGSYRQTLEKLVQKLSLQEQVFFAGAKEASEIPLWFSAADASVLASSREGWPNVVLESLACGTPVVATPVGQIPEILAQGNVGLLASQDPDSLASAIETALNRSWDREFLSQYAHERPWGSVAKDIESYLSTVISNGKKNML